MIKNYFQLLRVPQWIKNLFVFVPLMFSLHLFDENYFISTFKAFIIFCLASSFIYIINDIIDIKADASHPQKKNRPLPSGAISKQSAWITAILIFVLLVVLSFFAPTEFIYFLVSFVLLNVLYSFYFKHIVILDVFSIAAGFTIRVLGGAAIIDVPVSSWLILTTMFISLFLGVMKRHSELEQITELEKTPTRKVLAEYSLTFTNQMATVAAAGVIICYALYTVSQRTVSVFGTENLIFTTPFVVFGIFRFMYLEYLNQKGENTTQIMLTDVPMIITVILYIAATVLIVYKII
ncbi:MAG: decaprenyl-phosphate phosphoribosyltransferase [Ignavibacteriaceae bacterium]|nr:decaprenyl-phosphate phosphoribosyltransferase [Ignavibacterium sp.]MCC6256415.1 decaprenyl-phosphate phosphoribosyltransferase [Ignavibacteriaceae bacterium]HRN25706.1 decaprenyl-phosphate phosphoribosyltransferase [Ignavibacteriaceae bacterium]HRP93701.1 decaprenyl-phosphate phosphoribosyltransferase [Ignavibacteriaceae bacterium]HRQ53388.1 decaprenyl-phosphate phosphoribosyltransferase [Ignavibacteriaceae bacterium]